MPSTLLPMPPDLVQEAQRQTELEQQKKERVKTTSAVEKYEVLFGNHGGTGEATQQHTKSVGLEGSKRRDRAQLIYTLALGGSTSTEGVEPRLMRIIYGLCFVLWNEYGERQSADAQWCDAFAEAAARIGRSSRRGSSGSSGSGSGSGRRVCVLGLGSGAAALAAGRSGASVLWLERVQRFAQLADRLVARNVRVLEPAGGQVAVRRVKQYEDARVRGDEARFDAVLTEEASDDLLGDGLLRLARHAHAHLLKKGGAFVPGRARVYAAVASLRVEEIAGFDLAAFNAFRSNAGVWIDLEHVWATDRFSRQNAHLLSPPVHLFDFDLSTSETMPSPGGRSVQARVRASASGIVNCLTWWYELDLLGGAAGGEAAGGEAAGGEAGCGEGCGGGGQPPTYSSAPNQIDPLPFERRARRQQLRYLGYERYVSCGEALTLHATHDDSSLAVEMLADPDAERRGRLRLWPSINLLAYHFAMIADEGRNSAFDGALRRAIGGWKARHPNRPMRVLDIGSGSGLLAMMAARAGADVVHSLEMVPALAAAAKHIVALNGFADRVTIHGVMSTELDPESVGGKFDLLVCEIVDDQLLGEGVLPTIKDARERLLVRDDPIVIPSGAKVYVVPVEDRVEAPAEGPRAGLQLDDMNIFACDSPLSPRAHAGCKLQRKAEGAYRVLHPSVELFDFDFARGDLGSYMRGRTRDVSITMKEGGLLTAMVLHFVLRCDDDDHQHHFASGPANADLVAWDQSVRHLPIEMRLTTGQQLLVHASHDHQACRVGLPQIHPEMVRGCVGHLEILDPQHALGQEQRERLKTLAAPSIA